MKTLLLAVLLTCQDDDSKVQARRILDKCWQAVRVSLERLGVRDLEKVRESYRTSAAGLEKRLTGLPKQHRDALEKLDNPIEGFEGVRSQVNDAVKPWAPSIGSYVRFDRKPMPEEEGEGMLAKLVGTWKSGGKAASRSCTWTIGEEGDCEESTSGYQARPTKRIRLSFQDRGFIRVLRDSGTEDYSFLVDGDVYYLGYGEAVPLTDRAKFMFRSYSGFVVFDSKGCDVIFDSGLVVKAAAGFSKQGSGEVFRVNFPTPGGAYTTQLTYYVIAGHLVNETMAIDGMFRRVAK